MLSVAWSQGLETAGTLTAAIGPCTSSWCKVVSSSGHLQSVLDVLIYCQAIGVHTVAKQSEHGCQIQSEGPDEAPH